MDVACSKEGRKVWPPRGCLASRGMSEFRLLNYGGELLEYGATVCMSVRSRLRNARARRKVVALQAFSRR